MKSTLGVLFGLMSCSLFAADSKPGDLPTVSAVMAPSPPTRSDSGLPKSGEFTFSLLPKSFQRNPTLEMTVNTEFTDYGRLLRPATPDQPVYYVPLAAGYKQMGAPMGGEHPPAQADLERALKKALAVNGYLQAEMPGKGAALVLIYYWGSHNQLDPFTRSNFPDLAAKNKLERAILVGGKKYATEEGRVTEWGETLIDRAGDKEFLRYQIAHDIYYVVASAYDYQSLTHGERKLAWRTSMTVNTVGVSMGETLAPLIATAAPFFGHETTEPQIEVRKTPRSGKVEVGTPTVVPEKKNNP
jgi:hypothetical protein